MSLGSFLGLKSEQLQHLKVYANATQQQFLKVILSLFTFHDIPKPTKDFQRLSGLHVAFFCYVVRGLPNK